MPRIVLIPLVALLVLPSIAAAQIVCRGDCDGDGTVDAGDLRTVIEAVFDPAPAEICPSLGGILSGPATVSDLLESVLEVDEICAASDPPVIEPPAVYRTYPDFDIELPIIAHDPLGPLTYESPDLPDGASLDPVSGIFRWRPSAEQIGPFYVSIRVTNGGTPPASAVTTLALRVMPRDGCVIDPECDPASGCTNTLPPPSEPCCTPVENREPIADVLADCPGGALLMVGRNTMSGFGRIRNCDHVRLAGLTQAGVTVRVNIAARCVTPGQIFVVSARMTSARGLHLDRQEAVVMTPVALGFLQRIGLNLPTVNTSMELEQQEANLTVSVRDPATDLLLTEEIRVILQHDALPDLPDAF